MPARYLSFLAIYDEPVPLSENQFFSGPAFSSEIQKEMEALLWRDLPKLVSEFAQE